MSPRVAALVGCAAVALACGGSPTGPSVSAGRTARLTRTRFVAFGDSLTLGEVTAPISSTGVNKHVVVPAAAYPAVLQSQLQASYPSQASNISVLNQGKAGENIIDGVLRFDDVIEASRTDVLLYQEGINSLGNPGIEITTTLTRFMVQQAKDRDMRVFVGSMLPSPQGRQRSQNIARLEALNDLLRAMSVQEGVTYVDLYGGMLPQAEQLIGVDGLHPTEAGYRKIADIFFAAIRTELEER